MDSLSFLTTVILGVLAVCIPASVAYLLMDKDDDPRNGAPQKRGRADQ